MTALVTGASGHVGGVLVRSLLQRGRRVRALVHASSAALDALDGELELIEGDVLDRECMDRACAGVETVFHLAAVISIVGDPHGLVAAVNVQGPRNVAEAALAAGVKRMLHVSSVHAFDINSAADQIDEQSSRVAASAPAYDRSKDAGEGQVREVMARGLDAVILNPGGVLGPYDFMPSRMGTFLLQLAGRSLPGLVPGGFNWVDVRDLVASILAAEERGRCGENYLVTGPWCSMADVAAQASDITGVPAPGFTVPLWLAALAAPGMTAWAKVRGSEPLYTREALHAVSACRNVSWQKAADELGHAPRPLQSTLLDAYRWFAGRGLLELPAAATGEVQL